MGEELQNRLKLLPKIDDLLNSLDRGEEFLPISREIKKLICQEFVEQLRQKVLAGGEIPSEKEIIASLEEQLASISKPSLSRVVNATGVIIHTNLGRAPIIYEALSHLWEVCGHYSNLEYELKDGTRGTRQIHVRGLLHFLTGAESSLVVNNNAAAVLLVLNTLAAGREVIVSRGELVEIGGGFRIPEVMEKSGATLREVGTTNKTKLSDYEQAIGPNTALILKVHRSNFEIIGFTEEVELKSLVMLGRRYKIPVINDLGSGCLVDLSAFGLKKEPTVQEAIVTGADLVTISGDKLLGGPQAGIILGKKELVEKIEKNPLHRALRMDKLTMAALEGTLLQYLKPKEAVKKIHVLRALTEPYETVFRRAKRLLFLLRKTMRERDVAFTMREGSSYTGGGALPVMEIPTVLLCLRSNCLPAHVLEARLRGYRIPIISRIIQEEVAFDLRTVADDELSIIRDALNNAFLQL